VADCFGGSAAQQIDRGILSACIPCHPRMTLTCG
jgi:hypothetical protein